MKGIITCLLLVVLSFTAVGCGKEPLMDQLASDGNYHYRNKDLGFSLVLPPEFIYYQTQRVATPEYTDIEFFIPTNDTDYAMEVPSYAKPFIARIYTASDWQKIHEAKAEGTDSVILGEPGEQGYVLIFWKNIPSDWQGRWGEETRDFIIENFKIE